MGTEHPVVDTFDLLGDALAQPITVPELRAETPADLLRHCFDHTELLLTSPSSVLREAAYFQILEALLSENGRRCALRMLDGYGVERPEEAQS